MEDRKNVYVTVIAIAVVGLLLSCVAGALAGGLAGLLVGRHQARTTTERTVEEGVLGNLFDQMPWLEDEVPLPEEDVEPFVMPRGSVQGALVTQVVSDTPAEDAGLQMGDIITSVDLTPVDANHQLADVLAQYKPGDRVTLTVWRSGGSEEVLVILGENPDAAGEPYLGIYYRMRGPNMRTPGS
jgi:membrane-associated protease RseP (regulator of RpoE activity)